MAKEKPSPPAPRRAGKIGAVTHAIDVLRCLSDSDAPLGVNDIARRVGLHKSSVSRLVATLEASAFVQRDTETGRISLGMGLAALATPVLARFELRDVVRPLLAKLAAEISETVSFHIWDCKESVSIEQVPGPNAVQAFSMPGHRNPGHATASGKILLAHLGEGAIADYCRKPLRKFTAHTMTRPETLKAELEQCRVQAFAINRGEFEIDVGAVASPVFDRQSNLAGCVSVTVPMYRFDPARRPELAQSTVKCAARLSSELGYSGRRRR